MDDPRIKTLTEALVGLHAPGKSFFDLPTEARDMAIREAEVILEVLDGLRPPDIGTLSERQVEKVTAWAKDRHLQETVEDLKTEVRRLTSERHDHLKAGLQWAIEVLSTKLGSHREYDRKS